MEKTQKTAVEWLIEQLINNMGIRIENTTIGCEIVNKAKQMEKEQHKKIWIDSTAQFDNAAEMTYKKEFETYYNETFNRFTN